MVLLFWTVFLAIVALKYPLIAFGVLGALLAMLFVYFVAGAGDE